MKILLLTDIPPCENYTAGLPLSAMVRFVPRDEICCFAVVNPTLGVKMSSEFSNVPIEMHFKPNENWSYLPRRKSVRKLSSAVGFAAECITEQVIVRGLIRKAVAFGRAQGVDRVWAVLQGQTTIRMAQAVADQLNVPLHTLVWDPFSWWAKAHGLDGITTRRVQLKFNNAIRHSQGVATASEPMAALYREKFGAPAIPVISSHAQSMAQTPDFIINKNAPIVIGMAGQFYAANEWLQLIHALRASRWQVAGHPVRIVVMGPQRPPGDYDEHVSFLGWKSQKDAALVLSTCDILYCPYPFAPDMKEVSQFSFPSKLVLYLAAGRPILFHGPDYSSPAHYIKSRQCGLVADRLVATAIYNELERLVTMDASDYRSLAAKAQAAFRDDFTLASMSRSFNTFIGGEAAEEHGQVCLYDHRREQADDVQSALSDSQSPFSSVLIAKKIVENFRVIRASVFLALKPFIRHTALLIPRLRSIYNEIRWLYAQNATLKQKVTEFEQDILRLQSVVYSEFLLEKHEPTIGLEATPVDAGSHNLAKLLLALYPKTKTLLSVELPEQKDFPFKSASSEGALLPRAKYIVPEIACLEPALVSHLGIEWSEEWSTVSELLPPSAIFSLLRLILQGGFGRICVAGGSNIASEAALAAEVSRLASQRMTLMMPRAVKPDGWMAAQDYVDFIAMP